MDMKYIAVSDFIAENSKEIKSKIEKTKQKKERKKKKKDESIKTSLVEDKCQTRKLDKNQSKEKEFIFDIQFCLKKNGAISPTEMFVLDKIRESLNISPKQARELIEKTVKNFNKEKSVIIYRDAVAACLLDCGYLTATERFLLERLRLTLNLSDSIAYQIEKECNTIFDTIE